MKLTFTTLLLLFLAVAGFSQKTLIVQKSAGNPPSAYKVALSFHSIGTGVPDNAPFITYINQFKKKNKVKSIAYYRVGPLGREGEYDMIFKLTELKASQAKAFIAGLKKTAISVNKIGRGSVEVQTNYQLDKAALPSRASVEKIEI